MNTQRVKILLAAIEYGSLTKAGQNLGYTQSYLTQTMKAFEDEVGFPLLRKTNRGVEPTNETKMLIPAIRKSLLRRKEKNSLTSFTGAWWTRTESLFLIPHLTIRLREKNGHLRPISRECLCVCVPFTAAICQMRR